jgi:hypothetical protein
MQGKKTKIYFCFMALALVFIWTASAGSAEISFYKQGGINLNGPQYGWWYGCTATSAGMMMGYYDRNGYGGLSYANLVPGGVAETFTLYNDPAPNPRKALVQDAIASQGHVNDYYRYLVGTEWVVDNLKGGTGNGYGKSGDDVAVPTHNNNSLADFMGTNQDSVGNSNGSTTLYFFTDGTRFYARDAFNYGVFNQDGMYGMDEYFRYAGYGTGDIRTDLNFYTQGIYNFSHPNGMTFAQYKAEIDAGRVVMIHVEGHSMFGYGYTDNNEIIFDDTWNGHDLRMAWGDSYSGMDHWGVTCFTPTGGGSVVPLPSAVFLMGSGLLGLVLWKRRKP